jgi:hypothetical protein
MGQYKCPRCGSYPEDEEGLCYSCKRDDYLSHKCDAYGSYYPTEKDKEITALRKENTELKQQLHKIKQKEATDDTENKMDGGKASPERRRDITHGDHD